MLLLNYYTNVLINLILRTYFTDHRCLLVFLDPDVDHPAQYHIPAIKISTNGSIDYNVVFHYFGCQGVVIHSKNATAVFAEFEAQIRLNMERFNWRRFLIVTNNDKKFFKLKELEFVSDVLLIESPEIDGLENHTEPFLADRWFSKNRTFLFQSDLYPDKLKNQMGKSLKMATFTYEPYSIVGKTTQEHQGSELRTAVEFARMMNMTPMAVVNPTDYWGEIYPNGSGIGLLGNLVKDNADVGFSALYTWEICYHYLDLSKPLVRTGITCLVPAPRLAARWLTPLFSYSPHLWFYVIILFSVSVFIQSLIFSCYNSMEASEKSTYIDFVLKATKIVLKPIVLQPLGLSEIPWQLSSKLMLGLMLVLSLFLTSTYSSGLATVMTLPKYEDAIDTVKDFVDSDLEWGGTQDGWIISIQNIEEPAYVHIVNKFRACPEEELHELTKTGTMAFSIERLPFENFAIGNYIGDDVIGDYHLMQEDFYWEQCVIMLRKNSVLLPLLDVFILKVFEAGLISKWQNLAVERFMNSNVQRVVKYYRHHQQDNKVVKLKWSHVEGAFAVLAVGYTLSFVVFVVEIVNKKRSRKHDF